MGSFMAGIAQMGKQRIEDINENEVHALKENMLKTKLRLENEYTLSRRDSGWRDEHGTVILGGVFDKAAASPEGISELWASPNAVKEADATRKINTAKESALASAQVTAEVAQEVIDKQVRAYVDNLMPDAEKYEKAEHAQQIQALLAKKNLTTFLGEDTGRLDKDDLVKLSIEASDAATAQMKDMTDDDKMIAAQEGGHKSVAAWEEAQFDTHFARLTSRSSLLNASKSSLDSLPKKPQGSDVDLVERVSAIEQLYGTDPEAALMVAKEDPSFGPDHPLTLKLQSEYDKWASAGVTTDTRGDTTVKGFGVIERMSKERLNKLTVAIDSGKIRLNKKQKQAFEQAHVKYDTSGISYGGGA